MTTAKDKVRAYLHAQLDDIQPSNELNSRIATILATVDNDGTEVAATPSDPTPTGTAAHRRTWWSVGAGLAVAAATAAMIIVSTAVHPGGDRSVPAAVPTEHPPVSAPAASGSATTVKPLALPANPNLTELCSHPTSKFARFWIISSGNDATKYQGSVRIGGATVPPLAMYISKGQPGVGFLCISNLKIAESEPVRAIAPASSRPIAYLGSDEQSGLYAAVAPGVTKVTLTADGGFIGTYVPSNTGEIQLQDLGQGWHAIAPWLGYTSITITVRAYDAAGVCVDTRTVTTP